MMGVEMTETNQLCKFFGFFWNLMMPVSVPSTMLSNHISQNNSYPACRLGIHFQLCIFSRRLDTALATFDWFSYCTSAMAQRQSMQILALQQTVISRHWSAKTIPIPSDWIPHQSHSSHLLHCLWICSWLLPANDWSYSKPCSSFVHGCLQNLSCFQFMCGSKWAPCLF